MTLNLSEAAKFVGVSSATVVMRDLQQARGMANRLEWPEEKGEA